MKKDAPKFRHKVVAVAGDCGIPDLGLSENDRDLLIQEVGSKNNQINKLLFNYPMEISVPAVYARARKLDSSLYLFKQLSNYK